MNNVCEAAPTIAGDPRFVEAAHSMIARLDGDRSLESAWLRAAAETLATGRLIDPPIPLLKGFTTPARAWQTVPSWPIEAIDARAGSLADCGFIAVAAGDMAWLSQLFQCWDAAVPIVDDLLRLRAQGQIGLGLRPGGPRPYGWTASEISLLIEEQFLVREAPSHRAWCALSEDDREGARLAIEDYTRRIEEVDRTWNAAPDIALSQIWTYPGAVLRTECRALRALATRDL